ncbi:amidohydrolase family protein [Mesorhizobium sp. M0843]|uniref:amidohydrolase family protein n=1 Tax=Mesorhizobium sp. M0843 TaxID=2957010 RepID=UPI003338F3DE
MSEFKTWLEEEVATTYLADTHEHLVEESRRLSGEFDQRIPCDDWSLLFTDYVQGDLHCAGMSLDDRQRFFQPDVPSVEKFKLVAPYWDRVRNTGYARALTITMRELYGVETFNLESVELLASEYRRVRKPGFYKHILKDVCHISQCHVNSLDRVFMETAQPSLLRQDLSIHELSRCNRSDIEKVESELSLTIESFDNWVSAIDQYFEKFGNLAVAVKYWGAYHRRLDFTHVERHVAERCFNKMIVNRAHDGAEGAQVVEDYFFHFCLRKAQDYSLPVKIHTGYLATRDEMPLARVRDNAIDVCKLLDNYPGVRFILMHIGYPYQEEYIALGKQYGNAFIDMCWAWIINPVASTRFLAEFLSAVPDHKVLTFGGDYSIAENIVGHSIMARRGIAKAVVALVDGRWIDRAAVPELLSRLMHLNAQELFGE